MNEHPVRWKFLLVFASCAAVTLMVVAPAHSDLGSGLTGDDKPVAKVRYGLSLAPTFRGGYARTGVSKGKLDRKPRVLWEARAGTDIGYPGQPVMADGMVFSGSSNGNIYAFDAASGREIWTYKTGSGVYTSPTYDKGVVYAGSYDNSVYAIKAKSGKKKWSFKTKGLIEAAVCVMGGTVYAGSFDGNLYALNAATGKKRWAFDAGSAVSAAPACVGGTVFVGARDGGGLVHAVNAKTGKKKWSTKLPSGDGMTLAVAVAGSRVVVAGSSGDIHVLAAGNGRVLWSKSGSGSMSHAAVAVAEGLAVSCGTNCVARKLADGAKAWSASVGNAVGAPSYGGGFFYVPCNAGGGSEVVAVDAKNGKVAWRLGMDGTSRTSIGLFDGVLLHGTETGALYALGGSAPGGASGDGDRKPDVPMGERYGAGPRPLIDCSGRMDPGSIPATPLRGYIGGRSFEALDGGGYRKGSGAELRFSSEPFSSKCGSVPKGSIAVDIGLVDREEGTFEGSSGDLPGISWKHVGKPAKGSDSDPNAVVVIDEVRGGYVRGGMAVCFADGSWAAGEFTLPTCE